MEVGMKKFYEDDIKQVLLKKGKMFGDIGKSTIVFEKGITISSTIADCLIFTEKKGVIGVEIKTERDSTARLNKQLKNYSLVCDYVYVMCHDNHIKKVEQIMKRYHHEHVGIISYIEFMGEPAVGVYKPARKSPLKDVYHTINILWKEEILKILGAFRHYGARAPKSSYTVADRSGGLNGLSIKSSFSARMSKPELIRNLIARVGRPEANQIVCDIFIEHRNNPAKAIKYHHFFPSKLER